MEIELRGKRVLVVGLGIEGVDLVRYAVAQGAVVTANDVQPRQRLEPRIAALEGLPVRYELGGHDPALAATHDVILVSQGVPLDLPVIEEARRLGRPVGSLTGLVLARCPGPIVGVTGSSGKTTTTALLGEMFAEAGTRHVVGGNIGTPLLSRLGELDEQTWAVLEISHTQLELVDRSPHVAVVTNVTPNHLDRYTWDEYVALKRRIVAFQHRDDIAVLNYDDGVARSFASDTPAKIHATTIAGEPPRDGAWLREGDVSLRRNGADTPVLPVAEIPVRGAHNIENVLSAVAAANACGLRVEAMARAIRAFRGVPHRLEVIAVAAGVTWVNDSIATTPERTIAGLRSFDEPIVLLLGGREKHLPLDGLAREAAERCRAVVCFGEARELLAEAIRGAGIAAAAVEGLRDAVETAEAAARPGDVVLLSPACTSFDAYENFERRGDDFRTLVGALTAGPDAEVQP